MQDIIRQAVASHVYKQFNTVDLSGLCALRYSFKTEDTIIEFVADKAVTIEVYTSETQSWPEQSLTIKLEEVPKLLPAMLTALEIARQRRFKTTVEKIDRELEFNDIGDSCILDFGAYISDKTGGFGVDFACNLLPEGLIEFSAADHNYNYCIMQTDLESYDKKEENFIQNIAAKLQKKNKK